MSKAPAKAAETMDAMPAGKSKKKLIIIIAVSLLVLGIAGAGAVLLLSKKNSPSKEKEHKVEPAKAPVFVPLEPFVVNLQSDSGDKYLQVSMTLQAQDDETAELIKKNMPQVRSRMLLLLSSKDAAEILTSEGKEKLIEEIVTQAKQPFVAKGETQRVNGVFFTSFIVQ
jgi:flagellar FliL protein